MTPNAPSGCEITVTMLCKYNGFMLIMVQSSHALPVDNPLGRGSVSSDLVNARKTTEPTPGPIFRPEAGESLVQLAANQDLFEN